MFFAAPRAHLCCKGEQPIRRDETDRQSEWSDV
jgi:hypothetical protein